MTEIPLVGPDLLGASGAAATHDRRGAPTDASARQNARRARRGDALRGARRRQRLRPCLTLLPPKRRRGASTLAVADARALALPAAVAVEMIHSLLARARRPAGDGRRHAAARPADDARRVRRRPGDPRRATALLTEAFAVLADPPPALRPPGAPRRSADARSCGRSRVLAAAAGAAGMVGGQAIDLPAAGRVPGQRARPGCGSAARTCIARKTGALIRAAATLGAIAVGAERSNDRRRRRLRARPRPRVPDRRRRARRRRDRPRARQDRRQGRRGRQADVPGALRRSTPRDGSRARRWRGRSRAGGCRARRPAGGDGGLDRRAPPLTRRSASPRGTVKGVPKARLDQLLVTRGLAPVARTRARAHPRRRCRRRWRAGHESRHAGR